MRKADVCLHVSIRMDSYNVNLLTHLQNELGKPRGQAGQESSYLQDTVEREKGQFKSSCDLQIQLDPSRSRHVQPYHFMHILLLKDSGF